MLLVDTGNPKEPFDFHQAVTFGLLILATAAALRGVIECAMML
jgi:hypothetical protein|nr:MAG TPA: hypothetical protein [Caudoviricetes sp.]